MCFTGRSGLDNRRSVANPIPRSDERLPDRTSDSKILTLAHFPITLSERVFSSLRRGPRRGEVGMCALCAHIPGEGDEELIASVVARFMPIVVIPGRRRAASPESIATDRGLWIPGSLAALGPRNDGDKC